MVIWEGYNNYTGIILRTMQGIIIPALCEQKPAHKNLQRSIEKY